MKLIRFIITKEKPDHYIAKDVFDGTKYRVEKKLKRVRLKIDKDIDVYLNEEAYGDDSRFTITENGD